MLRWRNGLNALIALGCCIVSFVVAGESLEGSMRALGGITIWQTDAGNSRQLHLSEQPKYIHVASFNSDVRFRIQRVDDQSANHALYRLVGYDSEWQPLANGMTVLYYGALPTGHYRLQVQLSSSKTEIEQVYVVAEISVASAWGRTSEWVAVASVVIVFGWGWWFSQKQQRLKRKEQFVVQEKESAATGMQATTSLLAKLVEECQNSLILMASDQALQKGETSARRGFERLQALVQQLQNYAPEQPNVNPQIPIILRSWLLPHLDGYCYQAKLTRDALHIVMIPDAVVTIDHELLDQCLKTLISNAQASMSAEHKLNFMCMLDHASGMLVCRMMYFVAYVCHTQWSDTLAPDLLSRLLLQRLLASGGRYQYIDDYDGGHGWELAIPASWCLLQGVVPDFSPIVVPLAPLDAPVVLIVESDPDMSHLLLAWLGETYRLLFSASMQGAFTRIQEDSVDLVLSTARWLPDGDPREFLSQCKTTSETSHIPFILCCVSDCSDLEASAWSALADGYLSLPLTPAVLNLRLQALLENRQRVRAWLKEHLTFSPSEESKAILQFESTTTVKIDESERQFSDVLYRQTCQLLEQNTLSVESLAEQMNLSNRTLQRKIQSLFGMNYTEYVRKIQIQRVIQELENGSSIKMAARIAGFRDQAYLTRVFRQTLNMSPTEYRNQHLVQTEKN